MEEAALQVHGMDQRSPRNDKIARTTTIAPMSQMMLFMTMLS
jgi:hypothetical protein